MTRIVTAIGSVSVSAMAYNPCMSPSEEYVIQDSSGKRRVRVYAIADDSFTFVEERFSDDPHEQCWLPVGGCRSAPICASLEIAFREASGRVDWLENEDTGPPREFKKAAQYIMQKNAELYRRLVK